MTDDKKDRLLSFIDSMDLAKEVNSELTKEFSKDAEIKIPDDLPLLKNGVPVGKITGYHQDDFGLTVDFEINSAAFKEAMEKVKESVDQKRYIHSSWPSDDLTDIGWAMARLALEYANKKWNMELYASVRVIEDELLAIVNLYDPKTSENFGFACSNGNELLFDIDQEFEMLGSRIIDLFAKKRGKKT